MENKNNNHRKLMWSALGAFAFAVIVTSATGSGVFDNLKAQVDGLDGGGGYCENTDYDAYWPICETCYDETGNSQGERCWGTKDDDEDHRDGDNTVDDGHDYYCEDYEQDGKQCQTCYEDGEKVRSECRDDSVTNTWSENANQCEYYNQNRDGSGCKNCYDADGGFVSGECWDSNAKITPHDKDGNPIDDKKTDDKKKDDKKKDDKKDDKKDERCEKYEGSSSDEECEVCYDNKGKEIKRWCREEGADTKDTKEPKDATCSRENRDGKECEICYVDGKETSKECWGGDEKKANESDIKKDLNQMSKNLDNFKTKEFERISKDAKRIEKDLDKMLERMKKDGVEEGDSRADVDTVKASIKDIVSDADGVKADLESAKSDLQKKISSFVPNNTTWEEMESMWGEMRKLDAYWTLNEALQMRLMVEDRFRGFLEMKAQISRLKSEIEVSGDAEKDLNELLDYIDSFGDKRSEMGDMYEKMANEAEAIFNMSSDRESVDDALSNMRDEMEEFRYDQEDFNYELDERMQEGWDVIDNAWQSGHNKQFVGDMKDEIEMIKKDLAEVSKLTDLLKDHKNSYIKEAARELSKLIEEADRGLEDMKSYVEDGEADEEVFDEIWDILDDIGREAERWVKVFYEHENELSAEAKDLLAKLDHGFDDGNGSKKGKNRDDFKDVYTSVEDKDIDKLVEKIKAEVLEEVMRQISSELMTKLAPYIGEEVVAQILNGINVMGDKGESLLADSTDVFEAMDGVDDSGLTEELRNLKKETKSTLIVSSLKSAFKAKWGEVGVAAESGDKESLKELARDIKDLLAKNDDLSVSGDESYRYKDTKPDQWFFVYVYKLTEDGAVSGYKNSDGSPTNEYRPTNTLTIAEAAKMAVNGCGVDAVSGNPPTPWMEKNTGHWLVKEGFGEKIDAAGISGLVDMNNLNKAATREDVAVMIAQACKLDTKKGNSAFGDYSGKFGGHIQAAYDAGIFTGQGDTGAFEGSKFINRAEMSKVVGKAIESAKSKNVVSKLGALKNTLENTKK